MHQCPPRYQVCDPTKSIKIMKKRNHYFEKNALREKRRPGAWPGSFLMLFALSLALLSSCQKDNLEGHGNPGQAPLFSQGNTSGISNFQMSYEVAIDREVTFQNGLNAASPGWKKLESLPHTESYSLQVNMDNGNFYLLQDNIVTQSHLGDQMLPGDKMVKMEVSNGTCTTYNPMGNVISTFQANDLGSSILDGATGVYHNQPVDINALMANGVDCSVQGDKVVISTSIANGDELNSVVMVDASTSATLLELIYDDADPNRLFSVASHGYGAGGVLQKSRFRSYEFLSGGDVKITDERRDYTNFSLNLY